MAVKYGFSLREKVVWDEDAPIELAEQHGEGPFEVVGLQLLEEEELTEPPKAHPEMVTIRLKGGHRRDFSGGLLARAAATA